MRFHYLAKVVYVERTQVSSQSVDSARINRFNLDWLLVCNVLYSVPRYPSIPGLSTSEKSFIQSHTATLPSSATKFSRKCWLLTEGQVVKILFLTSIKLVLDTIGSSLIPSRINCIVYKTLHCGNINLS